MDFRRTSSFILLSWCYLTKIRTTPFNFLKLLDRTEHCRVFYPDVIRDSCVSNDVNTAYDV